MKAALLVSVLLCLPASQDPPRRHAAGDAQGLPVDGADWRPYHADRDHVLNRVFRQVFVADVQPAQVGAALPGQHGDGFWQPRWQLQWRDGVEADRRVFGGDGRQLPREGFSPVESRALRAALAGLDDAARRDLVANPPQAVMFQHDLLKLARRLLDARRNPELLEPLWSAIRWAALDAAEQRGLGDPMDETVVAAASAELAPRDLAMPTLAACVDPSGPWREVLRRSTRLFDAGRTLLWSRLFMAHPDGPDALANMLAAAATPADERADELVVPVRTRAMLLQGVVAVDREGRPYATPLIVDARSQVLAHRDGFEAEPRTSSRDGVGFGMLQLERQRLREGDAAGPYRLVRDDDQDLFRDYGTLKHTTYGAQCSLCHRTTGTPEPNLGGYPVLRPQARPRLAQTGRERLELAIVEVERLLAILREAIESQ